MNHFIAKLMTFALLIPGSTVHASDKEKRVVVLGDGVTGTWAAAKIAANLNNNDELVIVAPPREETVKNLGNGVFCNYTTSAFTPIGIQIEMGPITLKPPTLSDIETGKQFEVGCKLCVFPDLDQETKSKLDRFISIDPNFKTILRYHRDVCYREWQKYIEEGGGGADFIGSILLGPNRQALQKIREGIIANRIASGYVEENCDLRVIGTKEAAEILPRYAQIIESNRLYGLLGLQYDGRVKDTEVMKTLHSQITNGAAKVTWVSGWVESLKVDADGVAVTGVKLSSGETLHADVVVSALGRGAEEVLKSVQVDLPILKKWGVVYSLPQDQQYGALALPTIMMTGNGIVRDVPGAPINCGLGGWILPEGSEPNSRCVREFVEQAILIWGKGLVHAEYPIYVQARPMTLDGLPVLDSRIPGLIVLNPSGSQGNTQAPGSALFAASKVLEQLGRNVPEALQLPATVDWKQFELFPGRFRIEN